MASLSVSPEQLVAVLGAVTALVVALGAIWRELRSVRTHVNSRMDQMIALTAKASHAEGVLSEDRRRTLEGVLEERRRAPPETAA